MTLPLARLLAERPHAVYVLWSNERAVYVGMSFQWERRVGEHGLWSEVDGSIWNSRVGYSLPITHADVWLLGVPRAEAREVERAAIRALEPTHNVDGFGSRRHPHGAALPPPDPDDDLTAYLESVRTGSGVKRRRAS